MIKKIKENPIKYVKLFALIYIISNLVLTTFYYLIIGRIAFNFSGLLGTVIGKIPIVLFLIYTWKFYRTKKNQILLPLSYAVSIILSFYSIIANFRTIRYVAYYNSFAMAARYGLIDSVLNIIFGLIGLGIAIYLFIDCLSQFKRLHISKKLVNINAVLSLSSFIIGIIVDLIFGGTFTVLSIVAILMNLCIVFSLSAYIIFWNFAIEKRNESPIESNLKELKKLYENGDITLDEYNKNKAELLNNY